MILVTPIMISDFAVPNPHVVRSPDALPIPKLHWVCGGRLAFAVSESMRYFFVYNADAIQVLGENNWEFKDDSIPQVTVSGLIAQAIEEMGFQPNVHPAYKHQDGTSFFLGNSRERDRCLLELSRL